MASLPPELWSMIMEWCQGSVLALAHARATCFLWRALSDHLMASRLARARAALDIAVDQWEQGTAVYDALWQKRTRCGMCVWRLSRRLLSASSHAPGGDTRSLHDGGRPHAQEPQAHCDEDVHLRAHARAMHEQAGDERSRWKRQRATWICDEGVPAGRHVRCVCDVCAVYVVVHFCDPNHDKWPMRRVCLDQPHAWSMRPCLDSIDTFLPTGEARFVVPTVATYWVDTSGLAAEAIYRWASASRPTLSMTDVPASWITTVRAWLPLRGVRRQQSLWGRSATCSYRTCLSPLFAHMLAARSSGRSRSSRSNTAVATRALFGHDNANTNDNKSDSDGARDARARGTVGRPHVTRMLLLCCDRDSPLWGAVVLAEYGVGTRFADWFGVEDSLEALLTRYRLRAAHQRHLDLVTWTYERAVEMPIRASHAWRHSAHREVPPLY